MQMRALKKFADTPLRQIHEERLGLRGGPGGGRQPGAPINVVASDYGSIEASEPPSEGEPELPEEVEHVPRNGGSGSRARREAWDRARPVGEVAGLLGGGALVAGHAILGGTASLLWHGGRTAADIYGNYMRGRAEEEEEPEPPAPPREPTRPPIERPGGVGGERAQPVPAFLLDRDEQGNANQPGRHFRPRVGQFAQNYEAQRREARRRDRAQGYAV